VLGVLPGIIGTIQATETIKLILGAGDTLAGRLLLFDALAMTMRTLRVERDPACPICGDQPTIKDLVDYEEFCGVTRSVQSPGDQTLPSEFEISVEELKARLDRGDDVWILDVREPGEHEICRLPGATLVPLGDLPKRLDVLPEPYSGPDIVVYCKSGVRSATAVNVLRRHGYSRVRNLVGGVLEWVRRVDPTQPTY